MNFPVVYDVLMRVEIEARNPGDAADTVANQIAQLGIHNAVSWAYEIIRDDNAYSAKDNCSRHLNGFAIFSSEQKLELITKLAAALNAAKRGN